MVPIIVLGDYSNDLVVDPDGTTYDELSCAEKKELRDNITNINLTGVGFCVWHEFGSLDVLCVLYRSWNQKVLVKTDLFTSSFSCV